MGCVYGFMKKNEPETIPSTLKEEATIFTDQDQFPSSVNAPNMLSWVVSHPRAAHINESTFKCQKRLT